MRRTFRLNQRKRPPIIRPTGEGIEIRARDRLAAIEAWKAKARAAQNGGSGEK